MNDWESLQDNHVTTMVYGFETVVLTKTALKAEGGRDEDTIFIKAMWRNTNGNEYMRGTEQVEQCVEGVREVKLRWFGHEQNRDVRYMGKEC